MNTKAGATNTFGVEPKLINAHPRSSARLAVVQGRHGDAMYTPVIAIHLKILLFYCIFRKWFRRPIMRNRMKRPSLGTLATRFFAYAQLRKKETVETGEIASMLGLTPGQERELFRRLARAGWIS